MSWIRRILRERGYVHRSEIRRVGARAFAAAKMNRLTEDWIAAQTSIDADIRAGLVMVRARSRDLSQNNEYARAYLRAVKKNIVGSDGFRLQVKAREYDPTKKKMVLDRDANSMIEEAFAEWAKPETATITGNLSFRKVQELLVETVARDGEAFVRLLRGEAINRFGITQQLIDPVWVDEKYNAELPNGNIVRMGIEVDRWRRPVAYYVSRRSDTLDLYGSVPSSAPYVRIPASEMIHLYDPERVDQTRGYPWTTPVMLAMHYLRGYVEGAIINARAGANKVGFFYEESDAAASPIATEETDAAGNPLDNLEPGMFMDIGKKRFQGFDPKYPDAQFDPFVKSILRGISSGLGVSFASLSNDLTEVNFSSIRAGLLEERETWKSLQAWFIEVYLNRIYAEWLTMALMTEAVRLPLAKFAKFNRPQWTGRRWGWVRPLEEVQAWKEARAAGFRSSRQIIAETGGDIEDLYEEIAEDEALAREYGLTLDYGGKTNEGSGTQEPVNTGIVDAEDVADGDTGSPTT